MPYAANLQIPFDRNGCCKLFSFQGLDENSAYNKPHFPVTNSRIHMRSHGILLAKAVKKQVCILFIESG